MEGRKARQDVHTVGDAQYAIHVAMTVFDE